MNRLERIQDEIRICLIGHKNLAEFARSLNIDYKTLLRVRAGYDVKLSTLIKIDEALNKNDK